MSDCIDIVEVAQTLPTRRRGRACIVFTYDIKDQAAWAKTVAERTSADYINVLEQFYADQGLIDRLRTLLVQDFFEYLQHQSDNRLLIVSGIEFLMAMWASQADYVEQFAGMLEKWDQKPALLVVMQYNKKIDQYNFSRRFGDTTYIVDRRETFAL